MKNIVLVTLLSSIIFSLKGQEQYDVRKANWGMTINEVVASEYPLKPSETKTDEIIFTNVELSYGNIATIIYSFKNAKLSEVKYIMYGYNASFSRGTCSHIISLYDKINYTKFVFDALIAKGMKCEMGWYLVNCGGSPFSYGNCNLDRSTIDKMENAAKENNCERIGLNYENERTDAVFYFNQHQNAKSNYSLDLDLPCNSDFYNTYYWLVFEPSYKLKNEIKKSDF